MFMGSDGGVLGVGTPEVVRRGEKLVLSGARKKKDWEDSLQTFLCVLLVVSRFFFRHVDVVAAFLYCNYLFFEYCLPTMIWIGSLLLSMSLSFYVLC